MVEIGVLGYVYGEFGDTFATAVRPVVDRKCQRSSTP
jgi:hypothetical protein